MESEQTAAYNGNIYYNNTADFYIHYHATNIGKANNDNNGLKNLINKYEEQRNAAMSTTKSIYKNLFLQQLSEEGQKLLNEIQDVQEQEKILSDIDKKVKSLLEEKVIDKKLIENIFDKQKKVPKAKDLLEGTTAIEAYNELINILNKTIDLLPKEEKIQTLLKELLNTKTSDNDDIRSKGKQILSNVNSMNTQGYSEDDIKQIKHIVTQINALGNNLTRIGIQEEGKESITERGLTTVITNIFSTGFQELVASTIKDKANKKISSSLINEISSRLVGAKPVSVTVYDENGNEIKDKTVDQPRAGKTDVEFENIKIQCTINGETIDIILKVGLSNKAYVSGFTKKGGNNNLPSEISLGSGSYLKDAILDIYKCDFDRYLIYNVLAHQNKDEGYIQESLQKMYDLILRREFIRLASSRHASEFSQYILINGQLFSIWDIIQNVLMNNDFFYTSSVIRKDNSNQQSISLSIRRDYRNNVIEAAAEQNTATRVTQTNTKINNVIFYGKIHVNKLKNALSSSSSKP